MSLQKVIHLIAVILLVSPLTSFAQDAEVTGTISGTIGEEPGEWSTIRFEGLGSTSNFSSFMPGFTSYTIQGHVGLTPDFTRSITISFTKLGDGGVMEPDVLFLPTGSTSEFLESDENGVQIEFTQWLETDEYTDLAGHVTGLVIPTKRDGLNYVKDPDGAIGVDLIFSARAYPES